MALMFALAWAGQLAAQEPGTTVPDALPEGLRQLGAVEFAQKADTALKGAGSDAAQ